MENKEILRQMLGVLKESLYNINYTNRLEEAYQTELVLYKMLGFDDDIKVCARCILSLCRALVDSDYIESDALVAREALIEGDLENKIENLRQKKQSAVVDSVLCLCHSAYVIKEGFNG